MRVFLIFAFSIVFISTFGQWLPNGATTGDVYYTERGAGTSSVPNKELEEVEAFIQENNHLPGIPSATEMQEQGMSVGELTLYMIELKRENDVLKESK